MSSVVRQPLSLELLVLSAPELALLNSEVVAVPHNPQWWLWMPLMLQVKPGTKPGLPVHE
jgi:hypothetical protein